MPSHDRLLQSRFTRRQALLGLAATAAAPALASSFPRPALAQDQVTLTLVAYSTPREAYEEIIPLFQATPEGTGVQFETSFAASGEQSRAVEGGLPADVVALSLEPDITRLIEPGLVAEDWNADEYKGMVTDSVVVLAVRPGNPKGIATWDDLLKEGVEVITPNPLTSGGARWNIMAAYGAQLEAGQDRGGGHRVPAPALHPRPGAGQERARVAGHLRRRQGRRPARAMRTRPSPLSRRASSSSTSFPIRRSSSRTPSPSSPNRPIRRRPRPSSTSCARRRRSASSARRATARSCRRSWQSSTTPTPPGLFTIADLGGWPEVTTKFFDPDNGHRGQDRQQQ